ncbi:hypothetical protein HZ326_2993 [Fusarium oxysporum f. sp. albedinis]|nr:hypothetical protein HZ326_2993 [Fusarium oxysporum f. sp. albedinis]
MALIVATQGRSALNSIDNDQVLPDGFARVHSSHHAIKPMLKPFPLAYAFRASLGPRGPRNKLLMFGV